MEKCPPILFLVFNRPDLTRRVFARIREVKPSKIFIAADGPRKDFPGEDEICAQTRLIVDEIDWPCELQTLFRDENLGCKMAVSSAISWFFNHVEQGIILEDDCLPHISFFQFCGELLNKYSTDEHVVAIHGTNFQFGSRRSRDSYYFSRYADIWGWATWRRSWQKYDVTMKSWDQFHEGQQLMDLFGNDQAAEYWRERFDKTAKGEVDTWDYQWIFSCLLQRGMSIVPKVNLVSNIGFGVSATHTRSWNKVLASMPTRAMHFPLRHPNSVCTDDAADRSMFLYRFKGRVPSTRFGGIKRRFAEYFRKLQRLIKSGMDMLSAISKD